MLYIVITILANKIFHLKLIEQASLIYSNAGNLIIPLVSAVLGKEWVLYCCAYVVVQTFLMWSHGKSLICGVKGMDLKKILLNINIIAIFIGVILFLTGVAIPPIVKISLENTGSMIGPICMIVMGMLIGNMNLKEVFSNKRTYLICFGRLIIYPVLVVLIFCFSGIVKLHPDAQQILLVVLLAAAAPAAATVTQLAQVYDRESGYASIINIMSILFCIITMPAVVMLYEFLL
jgi:predicted permease